jgi:dihydrofolate reductase
MTKVRFHCLTTLDGYMAGPNQRLEEPFGDGIKEGLTGWMLKQRFVRESFGMGEGGDEGPSNDVIREAQSNIAAFIMGRNMFGPVRGDWPAEAWNGWWGPNPPYHAPVFVLTHYAREPLAMEGGTTFYFVTDGIDSALAQARAAIPEDAEGKDILIAGGANTINQYLAAGHIDEFELHIAPFLRGEGERVLLGANLKLEPLRVVDGGEVTHLKYRVLK